MSKPKAKDPRKLLQRALGIIDRDLGRIEATSKTVKLDHEDVLDLVRMTDVLRKHAQDQDEQAEKELSNLKSMSDADLRAMVEDMSKPRRPPAPKVEDAPLE